MGGAGLMESYVVRIYRRDRKEPALIVGLVEAVKTGEVNNFTCGDELSRILCQPTRSVKRKAKGEKDRRQQRSAHGQGVRPDCTEH